MERARPPEDISPYDFFTRWVPEAVASDPDRRTRLADTRATIEFRLIHVEAPDEVYALEIEEGLVAARPGEAVEPELRVRVGLDTWRALNRGDIAAPQALLARRLRIEGSFVLGLKLHLILS